MACKKSKAVANLCRVLLLVVGLASGPAQAQDLNVISALGMQAVLKELGPTFEATSGQRLFVTYSTLGEVVKQVQAGAVVDLIVLPKAGIERLVKEGLARGESKQVLATSEIGVAVKRGDAKPDVSTPAALKNALLSAKTITYSAPVHGGATSAHIVKIIAAMGIENELKTKTVFLDQPGLVGDLVAKGEVELAIQQVQELIQVPGIVLVGKLPVPFQESIVFEAAIASTAKNIKAAADFTEFLTQAKSRSIIQSKGMSVPLSE
jgi:molybdate transport system substrate-binding protein